MGDFPMSHPLMEPWSLGSAFHSRHPLESPTSVPLHCLVKGGGHTQGCLVRRSSLTSLTFLVPGATLVKTRTHSSNCSGLIRRSTWNYPHNCTALLRQCSYRHKGVSLVKLSVFGLFLCIEREEEEERDGERERKREGVLIHIIKNSKY